MKKAIVSILGAALGAALLLSFAGCGAKGRDKTLYIFNWTYYTPDSVIE